jgi:uncharacterized membrane protein YidH (DUF202 family)
MSKWDEFDGGRLANENTQRQIDAGKAYRRRQNAHYVAITLVILALVALFAFFDVRLPR